MLRSGHCSAERAGTEQPGCPWVPRGGSVGGAVVISSWSCCRRENGFPAVGTFWGCDTEGVTAAFCGGLRFRGLLGSRSIQTIIINHICCCIGLSLMLFFDCQRTRKRRVRKCSTLEQGFGFQSYSGGIVTRMEFGKGQEVSTSTHTLAKVSIQGFEIHVVL